MGDPQDRIALPLSDVIKKDWIPPARKKVGKGSGKQGKSANADQRQAAVSGGNFAGVANVRKGGGKGMVISKFNKKKLADRGVTKGAAKGVAKGAAKKGALGGARQGGSKGATKGARKAAANGAIQGGGKGDGRGKGRQPLASRIWSGAAGRSKGAVAKKGASRGTKGIGKGAAKGFAKAVGRGVGRGMDRTTMMAPNKRVNRVVGGIMKQGRDGFTDRGNSSMKGKGRGEQGKGRAQKGKGRSEKGGGKGWKGKDAGQDKGMRAGKKGVGKGGSSGQRDNRGSWAKGGGGNQGKGGGNQGGGNQGNWQHDRWEDLPGDRNATGRRAKSWDDHSKGRQGYNNDGWFDQRRNSGKGAGNAVDSLSADDRRMMKKITIVAQLDKVPKPPPAMRGAAVSEGRSSRGQGGSLSSRFGANFDR